MKEVLTVRLPTFSRQSGSDTAQDERPTAAAGSTVAKPDDETTTRFTTPGGPAAVRRDPVATRDTDKTVEQPAVREPQAPVGPKPRASLLATLGLVLGVVSAMLVLSGPLLGYGIGLAVLALILSLSGIFATGKRHVAGKSDALLGLVLSLAAIVVGVLALTGQLYWLGTDTQPVNSLREWLDAQFVDRF
jgi:hypothetical protein